MVIDVHTHLFADEAQNEAYLQECRRAGIDRVCAFLTSLSSTGKVADNANHWAAELHERHPDMVIPFARVDAREGQVALDELTHCVEAHGMRGLKLTFHILATDPVLFPVVERTIELRIPILFHAYMDRDRRPDRMDVQPNESSANDVAQLARRYPEAMIVMSHYNLGDWEYGLKAVKNVPNIYPCTSGSGVDAGSIEMGVNEVGPERIVFGTDNLIYAGLGKIHGAEIGADAKQMILGRNLEQLLTVRGPLA